MVCLGNICRSPLAEGILRHKINNKGLSWTVESAGTSGWHEGSLPHAGSIAVSAAHDIDITGQRSRHLDKKHLNHYDLIIVMDSQNYQDVMKLTDNDDQRRKIKILLNYSYPGEHRAVPDPYYTGDFDAVYDLIDAACEQLIQSQLGHSSNRSY